METIKDIVREMRKRCIDEQHSPELWGYLDRIEAAHRRELEDCALRVAPIVRAETKAEFQSEAKKQAVTVCNGLNEIMEEANGIAESVTSDYIEKKARRICDLCKQIDLQDTCKQSLQGNGAKMREALAAYLALWDNGTMNSIDELKQVIKQMREALSAPPRNCDVYNDTGEAMRRYGFPTKSKPWTEADWVKFVDWLYDEAKGEHNGK